MCLPQLVFGGHVDFFLNTFESSFNWFITDSRSQKSSFEFFIPCAILYDGTV